MALKKAGCEIYKVGYHHDAEVRYPTMQWVIIYNPTQTP